MPAHPEGSRLFRLDPLMESSFLATLGIGRNPVGIFQTGVPQRGNGLQPKVGARRLPWVSREVGPTPTALRKC
ncbi:MAG: hypothetical protein QOF48_906 [Verrucomicrobiota bacterium]|jgi:hypothetical protein